MDLIPRGFYDDFFDDFMMDRPSRKHELGLKCDVYEKDNKYFIDMDVPGMDKKDIDISLKDGYLTIKAQKSNKNDHEDKKFIRRERFYMSQERSFYLGSVNEDEIDARIDNGVLKLVVPKKDDNKKSIEIK